MLSVSCSFLLFPLLTGEAASSPLQPRLPLYAAKEEEEEPPKQNPASGHRKLRCRAVWLRLRVLRQRRAASPFRPSRGCRQASQPDFPNIASAASSVVGICLPSGQSKRDAQPPRGRLQSGPQKAAAGSGPVSRSLQNQPRNCPQCDLHLTSPMSRQREGRGSQRPRRSRSRVPGAWGTGGGQGQGTRRCRTMRAPASFPLSRRAPAPLCALTRPLPLPRRALLVLLS